MRQRDEVDRSAEVLEDFDLTPPRRIWLRQVVLVSVIAAALLAWFVLGLEDFVSFATLNEYRSHLLGLVAARPVVSGLTFVLITTLITALCIPAIAIMKIFGGFLFGPWWGTLFGMTAHALGGAAIFLFARSAFRETLIRFSGPILKRVERGFRRNALAYMIALRLMPLFPAWSVNLAPSLLGVPFRTFIVGTLIGAMPISFIFASFGAGIEALMEAGEVPTMALLLEPRTALPLLALMMISLLPVLYRRIRLTVIRRRRAARAHGADRQGR